MVTLRIALEMAEKALRDAQGDVQKLSEPLRSLHLIESIQFEVTNGGVQQWLLNDSGRWARETIVAFDSIGAAECANLVREMLRPFGTDGPAKDDSVRSAQVAGMDEETLARLGRLGDELLDWPEDVASLLEATISTP